MILKIRPDLVFCLTNIATYESKALRGYVYQFLLNLILFIRKNTKINEKKD